MKTKRTIRDHLNTILKVILITSELIKFSKIQKLILKTYFAFTYVSLPVNVTCIKVNTEVKRGHCF